MIMTDQSTLKLKNGIRGKYRFIDEPQTEAYFL